MTTIYVQRESDQTVARFVALTSKDSNDEQRVVGSDYALPILDVNHLRLHEGRAFNAYKYLAELAAGANLDIVITSNVGTTPHFIFNASCSQNCLITWYEGATASGGTVFTPQNRNRESTRISQTGVLISPTVSATGTQFYQEYLSAGDSKKASGSGTFSYEYVLQDNVSYLFRLSNIGAAAAATYVSLEWYE